MVTVSVTRYGLESDPMEVIVDARRQAVAEREARRIGLGYEYKSNGDFVDLHISGSADQKMSDFLFALKGHGVTGCMVTVETAEEETELGEAADSFDVCLS
jgi:hypothetical protein